MHPGGFDGGKRGVEFVKAQSGRLFAKDVLAGGCGLADQGGVETRGARDDDGVDLRVGQDVGGVGGHLRRAQGAGQRLGGFQVGIRDGGEDGTGDPAGDALGVEGAHPAGAD